MNRRGAAVENLQCTSGEALTVITCKNHETKKEDEHITNPFLILLLMEEILDLSEFAGRPLEDTYFKEPSSGSNRGIAQIYTSLYPSLDHLYLTLT